MYLLLPNLDGNTSFLFGHGIEICAQSIYAYLHCYGTNFGPLWNLFEHWLVIEIQARIYIILRSKQWTLRQTHRQKTSTRNGKGEDDRGPRSKSGHAVAVTLVPVAELFIIISSSSSIACRQMHQNAPMRIKQVRKVLWTREYAQQS